MLQTLLQQNAGTAYGRMYGFDRIASREEFQSRVPIVDYDALEPFIDRIADGEASVLTAAPVRMFERSSGSTSANKLIPYTDRTLAEFSAATAPWLYDLYRAYPRLNGRRSYWSVSAAARKKEKTRGGVPIGMEDDSEYFGPVERFAIKRTLAVPVSVGAFSDVSQWRRATLTHLALCRDLGMISVWSPTFLTTLMTAMRDEWSTLDLPAARRREVERAGALDARALWPQLQLVSCWTDGVSAQYLPQLRSFFPTTTIQGKGLLATEGVVSFPLVGQAAPVAAVTSHVLEFIDLDAPEKPPLWAEQLQVGGTYSPLLSTASGLYRYHLKDTVECVGKYHALPQLRFAGKMDRTSDLVGEKLNARFVEKALADRGLTFGMIVPVTAPAHYVLYFDGPVEPDVLAREVETRLREAHHYRYARDLGQLGPLKARRVKDGFARYHDTLTARGMKSGDIKPTALDSRDFWGKIFEDEGA